MTSLHMYKSLVKPNKFGLNHPPRIFSLPKGSDIEMISVHGMSYTSLKDLMPESPPSPTCCRGIPIKDPLLQHAAWAYLQPMLVEHQSDDRRWWRRCRDKFYWLLSCFNGVVLVVFKGWFPHHVREQMMIKI